MNLREMYTELGGSYDEALGRLMNDRLIERFVLKFPDDPTMKTLEDAVNAGNTEGAFRAAHTLKGVAANLAFTDLSKAASALTEQLRPLTSPADAELYSKLRLSYQRTTETIKKYAQK